MRSRTPGYIVQSADNASAKVLGECSIWTLLCPAVNSRNAPGMVASRRQQVALLVGYHAPVTTVSAVTLIPKDEDPKYFVGRIRRLFREVALERGVA